MHNNIPSSPLNRDFLVRALSIVGSSMVASPVQSRRPMLLQPGNSNDLPPPLPPRRVSIQPPPVPPRGITQGYSSLPVSTKIR